MSIIYSYPEQGALNANDLLIGTSATKVSGKQKNITRNFSIQQIADFINRGAGFVDPVATDFQIPVFNQGGLKITGSIMSQDSSPSNGVAGTGITIAGTLTTTGSLTVGGGATIGDQVSNIVFDSPTKLLGPILDSGSVQGGVNQILISNQLGKVNWVNYEAGLTYEGTWDAANNTTNGLANSPALLPGIGVSGHFYIVNVEGTTSLGTGLNDWHVGDWAVFLDQGGQPASWQKIDNTSTIVGSGTAGTFSKWTNATTLGDSLVSETGTVVSVNGDLKVKDTIQATTTNSNLKLKGAGTGGIEIMSADGITDGKIQLNCSQNSHGVTIQSPPHLANATYTLVLPTTTGNATEVLTSSGPTNSQLVWTTPTTGTVTGTGTENYVTKWSTGGTGIEDSTIFDNGTNVGIGTSSPGAKLHLRAATGDTTLYINGQAGQSTLRMGLDARNWEIKTAAAPYLWSLGYDGTDFQTPNIITAKATGNVGIGTTNPSNNFVVAEGTDQHGIELIPGTLSYIQAYDRGSSDYGGLRIDAQKIGFGLDNGAEKVTFLANGNVGIGTTSPSVKLHSFSSSDMSQLTVDATGAFKSGINFANGGTVYGQIYFNNTSPYNMSMLQQYSTGSLILGTNNTERMRIDSAGNVGIGTTSPAEKLDVVGNINISGTGGYLRWNNGDIAVKNEGSYKIGFQTYNATEAALNTKMVLDTNGNVGIGTTSPSVSLDISATDAVQMPVGTTLNRPSGVDGMLRYNSSNNGFEGYINGNWGDIGGGSTGGLIFRGTFNAVTGAIAGGGNLYTCPAGGSGGTVDIAVGDLYIVTTAGSFYCSGTSLNVGDEVICVTAATAGNSLVSYWNAIASGTGVAFLPLAGGTMTGNTIHNDNVKSIYGTSSDFEIYHNSTTNSNLLQSNSGRQLALAQDNIFISNQVGSEAMITGVANGAVSLFYDASKKFETTNTGVSVTGEGLFTADGINAVNLNRLTDDGAIANFRKDGSLIGYIGSNTASGQPLLDIAGATGNSNIRFLTTNTERIRITSTGNVGIGTSSPGAKLQVTNGTAGRTTYSNDGNDIVIDSTGSGTGMTIASDRASYGVIYFADQDSGTRGIFRYDHVDNSMRLGTDGGERMRITSTGGVSFGSTGTAYGTAGHVLTSTGNTPPTWQAAAGGGASATITTRNAVGDATNLTFALGATPNGGSTSFVDAFIDGVYQEITTYSISGTNLVFNTGNAPAAGTNVETKTTADYNVGAAVDTVSLGQSNTTGNVDLRIVPREVPSGTTPTGIANSLYIFTATGAASISTLTLPASPAAGDSIKISNIGGLANIIGANGNKIMGVTGDMTIDVTNAAFELIWSNIAAQGWIIIGNV